MVAHVFNPSTWDAEARGSPSLRSAWSTQFSSRTATVTENPCLKKTRNRKEKKKGKKNKTPAEACLTPWYSTHIGQAATGKHSGESLRSRCGKKTNKLQHCSIRNTLDSWGQWGEKRQAPCWGPRRNFSFLFAHNCFLSPYFKRYQLWDLSQKSGRKQFSQAPGKEAKDPKQHFLTHLPPTPAGSFVASSGAKTVVQRIPFRDSGSCTGYVQMEGVTVSPRNNSLTPKVQEIGCREPLSHKGLLHMSVPVPTAVCPSTHTTVWTTPQGSEGQTRSAVSWEPKVLCSLHHFYSGGSQFSS